MDPLLSLQVLTSSPPFLPLIECDVWCVDNFPPYYCFVPQARGEFVPSCTMPHHTMHKPCMCGVPYFTTQNMLQFTRVSTMWITSDMVWYELVRLGKVWYGIFWYVTKINCGTLIAEHDQHEGCCRVCCGLWCIWYSVLWCELVQHVVVWHQTITWNHFIEEPDLPEENASTPGQTWTTLQAKHANWQALDPKYKCKYTQKIILM